MRNLLVGLCIVLGFFLFLIICMESKFLFRHGTSKTHLGLGFGKDFGKMPYLNYVERHTIAHFVKTRMLKSRFDRSYEK